MSYGQAKDYYLQWFTGRKRLELKFKAKKRKSTRSGLNQLPVVFETT